MADNDGAPPQMNLEEILKTLAGLPPLPASQQQAQQQTYNSLSVQLPHDDASAISPSAHSQGPQQAMPQDPRLQGRSFPRSESSTHRSQASIQTSTPAVDPSTITEWKQGLRCVSKVAAQNRAFGAAIQRLIKDQEQNVKNWENGRTRLLEEQKAKRENEQKQRAAISLPVFLDNTALLRTPEQDQLELDRYHQKVYRACRLMAESHSAELKRLGVPFFGIRPDLILSDDESSDLSLENQEAQAPRRMDGKLARKQLLALQRKMLNHLVEMYGD